MRTTVNFNAAAARIIGDRSLIQFAIKKGLDKPRLGVRPCNWVSEYTTALRLYRKGRSGAVTCISNGLRERYQLNGVLHRGRYSLHFVGGGWYVLKPAPPNVDPVEPLVYLSINKG